MTRRLIVFFLLCFLSGHAAAQEKLTVERRTGIEVDLPDSVTDEHAKLRWLGRNIILFSRRYPQEKVYLHLDNTGYFRGETIFFKAYVVQDGGHRPTTISSVLYVELLLLTSELKGYVSHPEYYLQANDDEHRRATDLLMMVQGWRRYDLRQMMKGDDKGLNQPAGKGLFVFGNLNATKKKNTVDKVDFRLTLFNNAGMSMHGKRKTEDDGYFQLAHRQKPVLQG